MSQITDDGRAHVHPLGETVHADRMSTDERAGTQEQLRADTTRKLAPVPRLLLITTL